MVVCKPPASSGAKKAAAVLIGLHPPIGLVVFGAVSKVLVVSSMPSTEIGSITRTKLPFELAHRVRAATASPKNGRHGKSVNPPASVRPAVIKPLVGAVLMLSTRRSATSLAV